MLSDITPLILTLNEAPNIQRLLASLEWAREVVVIDSFSTDATESIACSFPNVVFVRRPFDKFANQWNFGLDRIRTEWVLSLDADYQLTDGLRDEISQLPDDENVAAYSARFLIAGIGGGVVGLFNTFNVTQGASIPPLAIAFLVGYAVDVFFSFLESLLQAFTKTKSEVSSSISPEGKHEL